MVQSRQDMQLAIPTTPVVFHYWPCCIRPEPCTGAVGVPAEIPKWQPALVAPVDPSPCSCNIPEFVIAGFDCEVIKLVPSKPSADYVCFVAEYMSCDTSNMSPLRRWR